MPRPGPRPYECMRRSWHSDRHHTLRGSLIQEIFRVVNEIHCPTTKQKKEWQKKLPVVVLRAEEILYSKANSEAEYMDLNTLCSRLNVAINTMIRRDESTESGKFLEPCVEAALSLGCAPRKGTRGQTHRGNSGRLTEPPLVSQLPVIVKSSNNDNPSHVQSQREETRVWGSGVYLTTARPAYHFLDSQQYYFNSIPATVVPPGSLVCTPSVANYPSQSESHFFYPSPCNKSQNRSLNFNQEGVSPACSATFFQQTFPEIIQGGGLEQIPQLRTRTETGLVCKPLHWPLCSTLTSNAISTSTAISTTSYTPHVFDVTSITSSSSGPYKTRSATSGAPIVCQDLDMQIQVPSINSQMRCHQQEDPAKDTTTSLNFDECQNNMYSPCTHIQTDAKKAKAHATMEERSSPSTLDAYDLQLRLGPPGNSCPTIDVSASCFVDPCSGSFGFRAQN